MRNFDLKKETAIIYLDFPKIENSKFFLLSKTSSISYQEQMKKMWQMDNNGYCGVWVNSVI